MRARRLSAGFAMLATATALLNCTAILGVSDVPDQSDALGDGTTADDSGATLDGTSSDAAPAQDSASDAKLDGGCAIPAPPDGSAFCPNTSSCGNYDECCLYQDQTVHSNFCRGFRDGGLQSCPIYDGGLIGAIECDGPGGCFNGSCCYNTTGGTQPDAAGTACPNPLPTPMQTTCHAPGFTCSSLGVNYLTVCEKESDCTSGHCQAYGVKGVVIGLCN